MADAPKWDGSPVKWNGCFPISTVEGATFVCSLPDELGAVTKLEQRNGKVIAHTESGIEFIVPVFRSGK